MDYSRNELDELLGRLREVRGTSTSCVTLALHAGGDLSLLKRRVDSEAATARCIRDRV